MPWLKSVMYQNLRNPEYTLKASSWIAIHVLWESPSTRPHNFHMD